MLIKLKVIYTVFLVFLLSFIASAVTEIKNAKNSFSFLEAPTIYPNFPWKSFTEALQNSKISTDINTTKISLLKGGFSSDGLFRINLADKNYVLRFMGENHSLDQRRIITKSFEWAGMNDLGPKNYLIDKRNFSFILSAFLEGKTLELEDAKRTKTLISLGKILSKLHNATPPEEYYQEFSQFTYGQKWYQSVISDKTKIIGPSALKEAYKYWQSTNDNINSDTIKKSMLHNDPNLRNVLLHGDDVILLDWELAGIGDPRKEIAHVCAWYGLNDELTHIFLKAYYSREPTSEELQTLQQLKTQILLEFAWVGLSTLKENLDQAAWNKYYEQAIPKTIEELSIIQIKSENKPSDEITRNIFLGLIKQFLIEARQLSRINTLKVIE